MKFKQILASFLAVTVLGTAMPVVSVEMPKISMTANAEGTEEYTEGVYESMKYRVYSDHIEISDCDKTVTKVEIPTEINGKKVTSIGNVAFSDCRNLTEITIPDSVTSIGDSAFSFCTNLTEVTIPEGITSIGGNAFYETPWLENEREKNHLVIVNGILIDGKTCTGDVVIPDSVSSIGNSAFENCSLTSITIPDSVTSIGERAFYDCLDLAEIAIPDKVTSISDYAFFGCSGLTSITVPDGVTSIGDNAFYGCSNLTSITIPENVTSIGAWAFRECSSLTSMTIPNGVTSVGYMAFDGCSDLTEIIIPDSVTDIDYFTFYGTPWIENKRKEDTLVIVNGFLIDGTDCSGDVVIPDTVKSIGGRAFNGCLGVTSITIPDSVTLISNEAFYCCSHLTEITIPDSVTSISFDVFYKTPWLKNKQKENPLVIVNGILIDGETCSGDVVIPESVTSIGEYAFSRCSGLTAITIPESVSSIGDCAFYSCEDLTSITIENPDCEIYDSDLTISTDYDTEKYIYYFNGTIYGHENSTAQAYAEKYGYNFALIGAAPEVKAVAGDANCDGKVSIADSTAILQHLGNQDKYGLSESGLKNADVDGNSGVTTDDALVIQMVDAKILTAEQLPLKK